VLALARKLHRAARSDTPAVALPVLRRVLATGTLHGFTLPALYRDRTKLRRKHVLRMLGIEAGYAGWENYRHALDTLTPAQLTHYDLWQGKAGYPNAWFSTPAQAQRHADSHGGRVVQVGHQAVVLE